ncbi:hypothetical protein Tco_0054142 [Tanacetum coccineum]
MEGYKLKYLKSKGFDSIQEMFDRAFKRQKVDDDKETTELKQCMEIILDEEEIYMLVEKKYPLTPHTLSVMLEKKLQIDYESEMAYQLCKLIIKQLKNLLDAVGITAAQVYVNTALMKLMLLMNFKENILSSYYCCIKEFDLLKWDQHRLNGYYYEEKNGSYGPQFSEAYSEASPINNSIPRKEKDPRCFTLPCFVNNVYFDNALVDLGASVSVMPLLTYLNLEVGESAHTKLTVELADRIVKYLKGIAENVLVIIGKFVFLVDFIILDMPKDIKVPLILGRPFLSTAHAKIDVYKRKITLRYEHVGQDTRSEGGKDDQDKQGKDLEISKQRQSRKTMTKAKDQGSQSMKEQAYNIIKTKDSTNFNNNAIQKSFL